MCVVLTRGSQERNYMIERLQVDVRAHCGREESPRRDDRDRKQTRHVTSEVCDGMSRLELVMALALPSIAITYYKLLCFNFVRCPLHAQIV